MTNQSTLLKMVVDKNLNQALLTGCMDSNPSASISLAIHRTSDKVIISFCWRPPSLRDYPSWWTICHTKIVVFIIEILMYWPLSIDNTIDDVANSALKDGARLEGGIHLLKHLHQHVTFLLDAMLQGLLPNTQLPHCGVNQFPHLLPCWIIAEGDTCYG